MTSIDGFLDIIAMLNGRDEENEYVQVKLLNRKAVVSREGIKLNSQFWLSRVLGWKGKNWIRAELE